MPTVDRIQELENQLRKLTRELQLERQYRREQHEAADKEIALLKEAAYQKSVEEGAQRRSTPRRVPQGEHFSSSQRASTPQSRKSMGTPTRRLVDDAAVFYTPLSNKKDASPRRVSPLRSQMKPTGPSPSGGKPSSQSAAGASSQSKGSKQATSSSLGAGGGSRAKSPHQLTPLEESWRDFCALVAGALTEEELALVSAETLTNLLDSFQIFDDVTRAQIEAQWSILNREVEESISRSSRGAGGKPDFDLRPDPPRPKLSKRTLLEKRPLSGWSSNPNQTCDDSPVTPRGGRVLLRPTTPLRSNPNDMETPDLGNKRRSSVKKVSDPNPPVSPRPEGLATNIPQPQSRDMNLRGIKSSGSTRTCEKEAKVEGLRAHIGPRESFSLGTTTEPEPRARGLRTYSMSHTPGDECGTPRGTNVAARKRDSILTDSIVLSGSFGSRTFSPTLSSRQLRTPFAVDY